MGICILKLFSLLLCYDSLIIIFKVNLYLINFSVFFTKALNALIVSMVWYLLMFLMLNIVP